MGLRPTKVDEKRARRRMPGENSARPGVFQRSGNGMPKLRRTIPLVTARLGWAGLNGKRSWSRSSRY